MTGSVTRSTNSGAARQILRIVAGFALVCYAWIILDLVTHPFSLGANAEYFPFLFRWLSAACGTYTVVVSVFILRRLPGNTLGFLLLLFGVGAAGWSLRIDFGSPQATSLAAILFTLYFFSLALPALSALLFHFPSGSIFPDRFSSWGWGLIILQSITGVLANLGIPSFQNGLVINPLYLPDIFPYAGLLNGVAVTIPPLAGVISLVLRYRAGAQRERQQMKWLAWLGAVAMILAVLGAVFFPSDPTGKIPSPLFQLANIIIFLYWQLFPGLAIGIALLRYRLWDIDLIIRRTLLYSTLTAVFGLIYFGSLVLLRQGLGGLTGESNIAVVLSTLLVAMLFEPVRRRVQSLIDRRFYRQKYDAALALEEFASAARREVELPRLSAGLVRVIEKTLQPQQAAVWIRSVSDKPMEEK